MSEETTTEETTTETTTETAVKKTRGPRKPSLKDWVRVQKSQGNALPNVTIHVVFNEANNLVELITNAHKAEDSDEMEGERVQIFKVTSFESINDPSRDPLGIQETVTSDN